MLPTRLHDTENSQRIGVVIEARERFRVVLSSFCVDHFAAANDDADVCHGGDIVQRVAVHRTPRKSSGEQQADERRTDMWTRFLGTNRDPYTISLERWESFIDRRRTGELDARGKSVAENERRSVRDRCVEADLVWLKRIFSWAVRWRTPQGPYLMRENPVRGYEIPGEKNPRRPVATTDRYEAIRAVSDQVLMEIRWHGKRTNSAAT